MNEDDRERFAAELEHLSDEISKISGLSRYSTGPQLDSDGIPIPDGIVSGYAISNLIGAANARAWKR